MKISLNGTRRVGSTLAYSLLLRGLGEELVLLDRNRKIAEGEALDFQHAEAFSSHPVVIRAGELVSILCILVFAVMLAANTSQAATLALSAVGNMSAKTYTYPDLVSQLYDLRYLAWPPVIGEKSGALSSRGSIMAHTTRPRHSTIRLKADVYKSAGHR